MRSIKMIQTGIKYYKRTRSFDKNTKRDDWGYRYSGYLDRER